MGKKRSNLIFMHIEFSGGPTDALLRFGLIGAGLSPGNVCDIEAKIAIQSPTFGFVPDESGKAVKTTK